MAFYLDTEDRQSIHDENPSQKFNLNYDIRMELDNSPIVTLSKDIDAVIFQCYLRVLLYLLNYLTYTRIFCVW
jgi:hypothetical protein